MGPARGRDILPLYEHRKVALLEPDRLIVHVEDDALALRRRGRAEEPYPHGSRDHGRGVLEAYRSDLAAADDHAPP